MGVQKSDKAPRKMLKRSGNCRIEFFPSGRIRFFLLLPPPPQTHIQIGGTLTELEYFAAAAKKVTNSSISTCAEQPNLELIF